MMIEQKGSLNMLNTLNIRIVAFGLTIYFIGLSSSLASEDRTPSAKETKEWIALHLKESPNLSFWKLDQLNVKSYMYSRLISVSEFPKGQADAANDNDCQLYYFHDGFTLFDGKAITKENFPNRYNQLKNYSELDFMFFRFRRMDFPKDYLFEIGEEEIEDTKVDGVHLSIKSETSGLYVYRKRSADAEGFSFIRTPADSFQFANIKDAERMRDSLVHLNNLCGNKNDKIRDLF